MDGIGVLMMHPMNDYLEQELDKRFKLFRYWTEPDPTGLLAESIRAVVVSSRGGAGGDLIDALPNLEIVSSFSVGLDKIDLGRCKEKGVRVTNTPGVVTDDAADLAIGLMLAVLRRIRQCDKYVRSGAWKFGDFRLTTKGDNMLNSARAFGCPIRYYSRSKKAGATNYTYYGSVVELASNSDILVVACALTPETTHIVNREVLNALGPKGVPSKALLTPVV